MVLFVITAVGAVLFSAAVSGFVIRAVSAAARLALMIAVMVAAVCAGIAAVVVTFTVVGQRSRRCEG